MNLRDALLTGRKITHPIFFDSLYWVKWNSQAGFLEAPDERIPVTGFSAAEILSDQWIYWAGDPEEYWFIKSKLTDEWVSVSNEAELKDLAPPGYEVKRFREVTYGAHE